MKFKPNGSLTLVELIVASVFLFFVFIGAGLLLNFVLQQGLLTPKRMMDLEEPVHYAFSHIQRSVFPAEEINLLGTVTGDSASAVEVIHDSSTVPTTGVIYALTEKDGDGNARELCYWSHAHKGEYPDAANAKVLAKNISRAGFGNAQTPGEHSNFGLLKVQITAHDYEQEGKPDQVRDFTLTCKVFARRARGSGGGSWIAYNKTFTFDSDEIKLYTELQTAIDEARTGDEIWLSGFDWEGQSGLQAAGQHRIGINPTVVMDKPLYLKGGYAFRFTDEPTNSQDQFDKAGTSATRGSPNPRTPYETILDGATLTGYWTGIILKFSPPEYQPEAEIPEAQRGQIEGIFFENLLVGAGALYLDGVGVFDWGNPNGPISHFPVISQCTFRNCTQALQIDVEGDPAAYRWRANIEDCLFDTVGNMAIIVEDGNNKSYVMIDRCIFRNACSAISGDTMPVFVTGDGDPTTYEFDNLGKTCTLYTVYYVGGTLDISCADFRDCEKMMLNNNRTIVDCTFTDCADMFVGENTLFRRCEFNNISRMLARNGDNSIIFDDCDFFNNIIFTYDVWELGLPFPPFPNFSFDHCNFSGGNIGAIESTNKWGDVSPRVECDFSFCEFLNNNNLILEVANGSEINYCLFHNNISDGDNPPSGISAGPPGIIRPNGNVTINHCVFYNNTASYSINPGDQSIILPRLGSTTTFNETIFYNNSPNDVAITGAINLNYCGFQQLYPENYGHQTVLTSDPFVDAANGDFELIFDPVIEAADPSDWVYPWVDSRPIGENDDPRDITATPPVFQCSNPSPRGNPALAADELAGVDVDGNGIAGERAGRRGDMGIYGGQGACDW